MMPPWISFMFRYERSALDKIGDTADIVRHTVEIEPPGATIPAYKWYAPLNALPRFLGHRRYEKLKRRISIDEQRCSNCGMCVKSCDRACWIYGITGESGGGASRVVPIFHHERCEFCLRCVHSCPTLAIGFNSVMGGAPRLNRAFYDNIKKQLVGRHVRGDDYGVRME